ncbi:MAG: AAA family ATPase [Thermoanaerobaculia bacterium]
MDLPARDLALLFRSKHPLVVCETVEEKRFEVLVRTVAAELEFPVWTWSAASGLSPCHPADQPKTIDLGVALRHVRAASEEGVWLLKDPHAHLENPATLRALREAAQSFEGSGRTIVLVGPALPGKAELEEITVRFEFALPGPEELRQLVEHTVRRTARDSPGTRIALTPQDVEGLVSDLSGLSLFEAGRALARAMVEKNALTPADRPRIRESTLVEGGGLLEFVPAPEGMDRIGGLSRLKKWIATRRAGFLPAQGQKPLDPPKGILLLGVQGCGKSLAAKAVAASWELPLLALDAGRLLAPYIGESERNLREARRRNRAGGRLGPLRDARGGSPPRHGRHPRRPALDPAPFGRARRADPCPAGLGARALRPGILARPGEARAGAVTSRLPGLGREFQGSSAR